MNNIQTKWVVILLSILFICMLGQVVIHWDANMKSVIFNGLGALFIGGTLIWIRKKNRT